MRTDPDWPLGTHEVQVWRADLDPPPDALDLLRSVLDPGEIRRAEQLLSPRHMRRSIAARGLLRVILSGYRGVEPRSLRFQLNPYGKPALIGQPQGPPLEFNLSHSGGVALYAIARGRSVGVDVEQIRPDVSFEELAPQIFSRDEHMAWLALPPDLRPGALYASWTRKEAFMKATGKGLSMPLDGIEVTLRPDEPARILRVEGEPQAPLRWSLCQLEVGPQCIASLAAEGFDWRLSYRTWPPPGFTNASTD